MGMGEFLEVNGCKLYVEDVGPRDATAVIVFHGGPGLGSHREPLNAFRPFTDKYRVVCCDQRGNGVSELKPPYTHRQWIADADALRVMLGLGEKVVIAGGSYGGFLAQEYTLAYPDRVLALILRDTACDNEHQEAAKQNALKSDRIKVDPVKLERIFDGKCYDDADFYDCFKEITPLYDANWDPARDEEKLKAIIFHAETHNAAFSQEMPDWDLSGRLHEIKVPTLIVCGRHDWVTPLAASEKIHALIGHSQLAIFENSGHAPAAEEPERWKVVVGEFLERNVG